MIKTFKDLRKEFKFKNLLMFLRYNHILIKIGGKNDNQRKEKKLLFRGLYMR